MNTTQGILEMASWYHHGYLEICFKRDEVHDLYSYYNTVCRLAKEGYLELKWKEDETHFRLDQMVLTTPGHKLLAELKDKSRWGQLSSRVRTMLWGAIGGAVTALLVSWVRK